MAITTEWCKDRRLYSVGHRSPEPVMFAVRFESATGYPVQWLVADLESAERDLGKAVAIPGTSNHEIAPIY